MCGDRGGVQVGRAGVAGVGVRLVQAGRVRAEGAVDEQVARGAGRAQLPGLGDVPLGPVADDARTGLLGGEAQQPGEVVLGGDLRAGALVDGADPERHGVREGGALGVGALLWRHGRERGGAHRVVGVGGERSVLAGDACRDEIEQGRGDDRGVDVDPAEVEGPVSGGLVEFGTCRGAAAGPACGVPAVPEQHAVVRPGGGEVPYEAQGGLE